MLMKTIVRRFSTQAAAERWFDALQSPSTTHEQRQKQLAAWITNTVGQHQSISPKLLTNIVQRWAVRYPTRTALYTCDLAGNATQTLTFGDVYAQSSHIARALTGNDFQLDAGDNVLVILPCATKERLLIQLACLQADVVFHSWDLTKELTAKDVQRMIRTLAIDCVITDRVNLAAISKCTQNPARPLKRGLVDGSSTLDPLPVGWHHLKIRTDVEPECQQSDDKLAKCSYSSASILRPLVTAYWLNRTRPSRLMWIKDGQGKISLAPWLLGSGILYGPADHADAMLKTLQTHPIDTLCGSAKDFDILVRDDPHQKTHLEQLLSLDSIDDATVKRRWHSLTHLHIQDDCIDHLVGDKQHQVGQSLSI